MYKLTHTRWSHTHAIQLMELQRNTHPIFRLMYHFLWLPKYRHKVFSEPYRSELKAIIQKIGYDYNIGILELEVPVDHIHMIVRSEPKISPSKVMQGLINSLIRLLIKHGTLVLMRYLVNSNALK